RARHCEGAAQLQAAGGRLLRAPRERARRHGLVRGERRDGVPLPLQDPHGLLRRHQHRPQGEPQPHDRRPDRRDREPRSGRAGDRPLMQEFVDGLVANPSWVHYLGAMLVFGGIVVFGFVLPIAGITTWVERRVAGRIQSRIGPNRTGPAGFLQWLADGIKSLLKEDIVPVAADAPLFKLAPYVVMTGFVGAFVALPFGGPLIIAFFIFFVAALADGNRTPFDLPEAESELVMGFATEYSGMRNLLFIMAEWGNLYVIGAIVTTLFLGGWQIPWALAEHPVPRVALQFVTFFLKSYFWVFVAVWLRWTLPRIRVDQMMIMCWKYLVPVAFV